MDTRIERFPKTQFTKAQAQQAADDHVKFGGALSSTVSEDATAWIVTTQLAPVAADDDAPAGGVAPAVAAAGGAALGAAAAGPVGAMLGAGAGVAVVAAVASAISVNLDAATIPKMRKPVASQIVQAFAAAGFAAHHQAAALANAIAESDLNPAASAETNIESSYGLFQLNTEGGLGVGHTKQELIKPEVNIAIILAAARSAKTFPHAATLTTAVAAFVREVERPADPDVAIQTRLKIAKTLLT